MRLVAEMPHEQYGSALFVSTDYICESTSTTNNVEIIKAQLDKLMVTSEYKPPNERFSFGSDLSHSVDWDTNLQTKMENLTNSSWFMMLSNQSHLIVKLCDRATIQT